MSNMQPTAEQEQARDLFATGRHLVIEAGAGTGKTSTLELLASSTPRRGQYLAFNKSIVVEAGAKFPRRVTCSTAHSLAYRAVGARFGHRLRGAQRMRSADVARLLGLTPLATTTPAGRKVLAPGFLAGVANRAITRFCQTADAAPSERHVAYIDGIDLPTEDGRRTYANNRLVARAVGAVLPAMWRDLSDPGGRLTYKHEHYLKLWQLQDPVIAADFILFDEAQDANPVMRAIVLAQSDVQVVWVGDSNQAIYEWNGAVNALAAVVGAERSQLSQSFRFGPAVAEVANMILARLASPLSLVGSASVASVVGPIGAPDAILCRTNAAAFEALFDRQRAGEAVHLIGGGSDVIAFARAAGELLAGGRTYHPELACFESWGEVVDYVAHDEQGGELKVLVNLVEEYGVPAILSALERMPPEAYADVVVSTAHKAKGREWASVALAGDFPPPAPGGDQPEELRLLYVACTRARLALDPSACWLFAKPEPASPAPVGA
jgi:hypothetical protein